MMSHKAVYLLGIGTSLALSLALTPLVRWFARRIGVIAKPKTNRWHKNPTALLGGTAIFLSVLITNWVFVPSTQYGWVVIFASSFMFLVGLADDLLNAKPYQKLIGQVMGSAVVVYYGLSLPWTGSQTINMCITIFWLIGITNAVNLLDNMDGLAAGVAMIASVFLALSFHANNLPTEAFMLGIFAAALLGFLIYNSNPASIFMGDCGSMFIGFMLASLALVNVSGGRSRSFLPVLVVPILILFIPIFDTTFVTLLRKLSGRAASEGGRDHTSHRLVALGMSERRAVWMLYGFAALSGLLALFVREMKIDLSLAVILGYTVVLTLLGVYLAGVKVYGEEDEVKKANETPLFAFLIDVSYKRRIFEVMLDLILIVLSYYFAYTLQFGSMEHAGTLKNFLRTLPVLVCVQLAVFLVLGVYRGIWRYTSVDDLVVFAKAVALGTAVSILVILFRFRFEGFSRAVFVLDALLLFLMLAGSRMAFRVFRHVLPTVRANGGRRILIYGAGDGGELLLRELINNPDLHSSPVGFIDDDPKKTGMIIHGLQVYSSNGDLQNICEQHKIDEVVISSSRISEQRVEEILRGCEASNVTLKRMRIKIEQLSVR